MRRGPPQGCHRLRGEGSPVLPLHLVVLLAPADPPIASFDV